MKHLHRLMVAAFGAAFFIAPAFAQNAGTATSHAFMLGKGPGTTGYTSLLCTSAQLAVGQSAADPICRTITGDVTLSTAGVTAIGSTKVTSAMLNADVFSTAHSWSGGQTFSGGGSLGGSWAQSTQAGNPGNSSFYLTIANPANGYTTLYNAMQFSQGTAIPASQQFGANIVGIQQGIVGTIQTASGDTGLQGNGVAGYAISNSTTQTAVGTFGQAAFNVNGGNAVGLNGIAQNCGSVINNSCFNINTMSAAEFNPNFWTTASGNPTIAGQAYGITIQGGGNVTGASFGGSTNSGAIGIGTASAPSLTNIPWTNGIFSIDGGALTGLHLGAISSANGSASQSISLDGLDAGGVRRKSIIQADQNGALLIVPSDSTSVSIHSNSGSTAVNIGLAGQTNTLGLFGSTSGSVAVKASAVASGTMTIPSATDTLVGKATTDTLSNKTIDTAGPNTIKIAGVDVSTGWTTYTPTVTSQTGTPTTVSATGRYKQIGKTVFVQARTAITTVGTATGALIMTLPLASTANDYAGSGVETSNTGKACAAFIANAVSTSQVRVLFADATTTWVNGNSPTITMVYEVP